MVQLLVRADAAIISAMRSKETIERNFVLIVTTVPIFLAAFMGSSVNIALPNIGKEFGMSAVSLGWVATAFLLTTAMFQVPFGRIADIHGRKKVFRFGLMLYTLSSLLAALSNSATLLISSQALQGISGSMMFGTSIAVVASGILGTMRSTGMMFSMGIVMVTFAVTIGGAQITPEYYPSFLKSIRIAFSLFAFLCFCGIFASLSRGDLH